MRTPKLDIDIYYASSVSDFTGSISGYLKTLDKNELTITTRFKHAELRDRYIICHGVLRHLLAKHVNQSPTDLRIEKTEFGKPFLPDYPELSFNMSHSGNILAIAISSLCQLGIDVECYKERNNWEGLVKKCFATEESDFWYSLDQAERSRAFYQFWVKKEAFVKAVGKGISLGLNQCVINPEDLNSFLRVPDLAGIADNWQVYSLNLAENQFGAVVCDKKNTALRIINLQT